MNTKELTERKHKSVFTSLFTKCIDAYAKGKNFKKAYLKFEEECERLLSTDLNYSQITEICQLLFSSTDYWKSMDVELILQEDAYDKYLGILKKELGETSLSNDMRWFLLDNTPPDFSTEQFREIGKIVFTSIKENNPSEDDLYIIKVHLEIIEINEKT